MYDGGQLALLGDVVVVTVNHRLASFGYTHLAAVGAPEEFRVRRRLRRHGHGRVARMGARQHRRVRRRSVARDDLRPVGRRLEDVDAARPRRPPRGCSIAPRSRAARRCGSSSEADAEKSADQLLKKLGPRAQSHRRHPAPAVGAAARSAGGSGGGIHAGDGRPLPAASSVRSGGAARVARRAGDHLDDARGRGAAADELGPRRERPDRAAQRALQRQGRRDPRAVPTGSCRARRRT